MNDTTLVERRLPKIGARTFPFGRSWGQIAAMLATGLVLCAILMVRSDTSTIIVVTVAFCVLALVFLVPLNLKTGESFVDIAPRYAAFGWRVTAGSVDVHFREVEGRHYTHRTIPTDIPMSVHLGSRMWLSSFNFRGQPVGLIVEGGTRLRPWRAAYMVAVQVSGHDQLLLESVDYQETLLRRWTTTLDSLSKKSLGLSGFQELMLSRPRIQGEGADWTFDDLLASQPAALADRYRQIQLDHDATDTDRRMYLVLRSGGTFASWIKARHYGSNRAGVEEHFRGVLAKLSTALRQATLTMLDTVTADHMAALLRLLVDPTAAPVVGYRELETRSTATHIAPIAQFEEHFSHLIVNGLYTQTFRVIGWPDRVVGPQFLASALRNHQGGLRVSVAMAPEDKKTSVYATRAGITNAAGKADRRAAKGTVTTEQERIVDNQPAQRDVEMAAGHHPVMFVAYFTLIAEDKDSLRRAADELNTQCDAEGVDLGCCHGWQPRAYTLTLPFCRGV